jgi:hypothetical protein
MLAPVIAFALRFPARLWSHPAVAPAAAIAIFLLMYIYDCTANAMVNPVYTVMMGALSGLVANKNPMVED